MREKIFISFIYGYIKLIKWQNYYCSFFLIVFEITACKTLRDSYFHIYHTYVISVVCTFCDSESNFVYRKHREMITPASSKITAKGESRREHSDIEVAARRVTLWIVLPGEKSRCDESVDAHERSRRPIGHTPWSSSLCRIYVQNARVYAVSRAHEQL